MPASRRTAIVSRSASAPKSIAWLWAMETRLKPLSVRSGATHGSERKVIRRPGSGSVRAVNGASTLQKRISRPAKSASTRTKGHSPLCSSRKTSPTPTNDSPAGSLLTAGPPPIGSHRRARPVGAHRARSVGVARHVTDPPKKAPRGLAQQGPRSHEELGVDALDGPRQRERRHQGTGAIVDRRRRGRTALDLLLEARHIPL